MSAAGWFLLALVSLVAGGLAVSLVHARTSLRRARAENAQLQTLVKKRVERPNIFSHEVRTPLTLIQGAAELLAEESPGPLNERQREFVTTIAVKAQDVIGLAQDLLTEARMEAELFELHREPVDLRTLARETVRDARRVHGRPIQLSGLGAPVMISADRALLTQAVWNLVNNACRHAGESATITVSVTASEDQAIVSVSDDGGGLTIGRDRLFEPFASSDTGRGTGLGMMITEQIVTQHGGRLYVDSLAGRGTTIYFTLPMGGDEANADR